MSGEELGDLSGLSGVSDRTAQWPDSGNPIIVSAENVISRGVKGHDTDCPGMQWALLDGIAGAGIPDVGRSFCAGGDQEMTVRANVTGENT